MAFNCQMAFLFLVLSLSISYYGVGAENNNIPEMHHSFTRSQAAMDSDFDCIDIYKQPAFDHPLMKNHKIQLKPTDRMQSRSSYIPKAFQTHNFITRCPPGSVPIHRIKMGQLINSTSSETHIDNLRQYAQSYPGHHFATLDTTKDMTCHGASAMISVFNLSLQGDQYSMSQIWLQSGPPAELNIIKVGLGVYPRMYEDTRTRITSFWTVDNFQKTGCINTNCLGGFVQVDRRIFLGAGTTHQSVIGSADDEYSITFRVKQDQKTGHWWLRIIDGDGNVDIGYWPKEMFTHLNGGSSLIRFGGETFAPSNMSSPPMGCGMLPDHDFKSSAYMATLQIVDSSYNQNDVIRDDMKTNCDTSSNCYDVWYNGDLGPDYKQAILFGGPGGHCGV